MLLALGAWLVFSPVWRFEFFRFDDPQYILDNPAVKAGLTGPGLAWALRATQAGNWHPLTWVSHMLDCQLFGSMRAGFISSTPRFTPSTRRCCFWRCAS